jgi:hypothetical protein
MTATHGDPAPAVVRFISPSGAELGSPHQAIIVDRCGYTPVSGRTVPLACLARLIQTFSELGSG